jgi:REP element-mobilizing transposase RayT
MPRQPRIYLPEAVYHVTLEGPYNEPIFVDGADYQKYLELLGNCRAQHPFKLYSYSLLPNRLHLLLEASEDFSISQIMQKITPLYTKYFNQRRQRKGSLFQKRYRSVIVEKQTFLPSLVRYIHLTPVLTELVSNAKDYPYSSHAAYVQAHRFAPMAAVSNSAVPEAPKPVLDLHEEVEAFLALLPSGIQEEAYERFLLSADKEELEVLDRKLSRGFVLGSEAFVAEVKERMKKHDGQEMADESGHETGPEALEEIHEAQSEAAAAPDNRRMLVLSSFLVLAVSVSAFSLYLNQAQPKTPAAVSAVQAAAAPEPVEKTKIEFSKNPDLNGTIWEVELVAVDPDGKEHTIKDKIHFSGKAFQSNYFSSQGFSDSNYSVTVHENGVITWETMQKNEKGETVTWRGDLSGQKMEGIMQYQPSEQNSQDFWFMSKPLVIPNA